MSYSATYSPDDNKLRLYASSRLDSETFARVKAAGFKRAPKQEVFVAPMWTPNREDLLLELAGEIEDEDKSLVERAEERADRFEDYSEKRAREAASARKAVDAICEHIPLGQPILVGHHSERHARKDAERIETGMRKAVKLFRTSQYWEDRAAGALAHAKYKELPGVRQRRIKGLESDLRKVEKEIAAAAAAVAAWSAPDLDMTRALHIANYNHVSRCFPLADFPRDPPASQYEGQMGLWSALDGGVITPAQAAEIAIRVHSAGNERRARWAEHYRNRLTYERAMLAEQGGGASDRWPDMQPGGQVQARGRWEVILRVNRKDGRIVSVTTTARYVRVVDMSEVSDYRAPSAEDASAVAAVMKKPPLCNYQGEGFNAMTQAEWDSVPKDYKATMVIKATDTVAAHRIRRCSVAFIKPRPAGLAGYDRLPVFISDAKVTKPPPAGTVALRAPLPAPLPRDDAPAYTPRPVAEKTQAEIETEAMQATLKAGVKVVAVPQLFPTPRDLAEKVAELADVQPGQRVLEPSAGTGALLGAMAGRMFGPEEKTGGVVAVEINHCLADRLRHDFPLTEVHTGDFLALVRSLGRFDRIVMNPPFAGAADIVHIKAAAELLNPGGRLVAICANGPRQREHLVPLASHWEDLPAVSFESSGTGVNAALLVIEKPAAPSAQVIPLPVTFRKQADMFAAD